MGSVPLVYWSQHIRCVIYKTWKTWSIPRKRAVLGGYRKTWYYMKRRIRFIFLLFTPYISPPYWASCCFCYRLHYIWAQPRSPVCSYDSCIYSGYGEPKITTQYPLRRKRSLAIFYFRELSSCPAIRNIVLLRPEQIGPIIIRTFLTQYFVPENIRFVVSL